MRPKKVGPGQLLSLRRQRTLTRKTGRWTLRRRRTCWYDIKEEIRSMKAQMKEQEVAVGIGVVG